MISQTAFDLIYLLACAAQSVAPAAERLSACDRGALLRLASRHSLAGMVCYALEDGGLLSSFDEGTARAFRRERDTCLRRELLMDAEWDAIRPMLDDAGIAYLPLKGMELKKLYPRPGMRYMSDYDLWYDANKRDELHQIMESRGYTDYRVGASNEDDFRKMPLCHFEMHTALFKPSESALWHDYYADLPSRLLPDGNGGGGLRFTDEDQYLYLLLHTKKHYDLGGTGLRSLLDCFLFLRRFPSLDREYLAQETRFLGIEAFEADFSRLALAVFSQPGSVGSLSAGQESMLDYILRSGTYGTTGADMQNRLRRFRQEGSSEKGAKRRYLLTRLFPSAAYLKSTSRFCARHPYLIPFFRVYRIFRAVFCRNRAVKSELTMLSGMDTDGRHHDN